MISEFVDNSGGRGVKIANGERVMSNGEYEKAVGIFEEILKEGCEEYEDEMRVKALMVLGSSYYDVDYCENLVNELPGVEEGDGEELEVRGLSA